MTAHGNKLSVAHRDSEACYSAGAKAARACCGSANSSNIAAGNS